MLAWFVNLEITRCGANKGLINLTCHSPKNCYTFPDICLETLESFLRGRLYERNWFTFSSSRYSENRPGLKMFIVLYDSGPEKAIYYLFNCRGQFYILMAQSIQVLRFGFMQFFNGFMCFPFYLLLMTALRNQAPTFIIARESYDNKSCSSLTTSYPTYS